MPRNPTTGVYTRTSNSFSNPSFGTIIDPTDADALFDEYDAALTLATPVEPTQVTTSPASPPAGAGALAVVRTSPTATTINLPAVATRDGYPLPIFDWSTSIAADHVITLVPSGAETIMRATSWQIVSTSVSLASITLYPSTTLSGWYIA